MSGVKYIDKSLYLDGRAARQVMVITSPRLDKLFDWLEKNLTRTYEKINVFCWYGQLFYVTVEDLRVGKSPQSSTIGFTVDVGRDVINWNYDFAVNSTGGHCFVRSKKWKTLVKKQFPQEYKKGMSHYQESAKQTIDTI